MASSAQREKSTVRKIGIKIKDEKKDTGASGTKMADNSSKELPRDEFSHDAFLGCWNVLAASYKEESLALFMAMTKQKPRLQDNFRVLVEVDNAIQADLIREKMPDLLGYLHRELNNHFIRIETGIQKEKARQKAYLPKEKLQELIKKNPHIRDLKDSLGLDLEY